VLKEHNDGDQSNTRELSETAIDEAQLDEDAADLIEAGEEIDVDTISEQERQALASEEMASIGALVDDIRRFPIDTRYCQAQAA
jgi:hypothetical protein